MIARASRFLAALLCTTSLMALDATPFLALADGDIHADRVTVFGFVFRDVTGTPVLKDNKLHIGDITARMAGGTAHCVLNIDFMANMLTLKVTFTDVDLAAFLEEFGGGADGVSGVAEGWWEMEIPLDDRADSGRGAVSITKGDLLRLGPLSSLLLGDSRAAVGTDRAETRVELEGDRLRLRGARITTSGATVSMLGTVGFDGTLEVLAIPYPEFALLQVIPGLGDVTAWLLSSTSSHLARARIRGTLGNPAVTIAPFAAE